MNDAVAEPTFEVSLEYSCHCRDVWMFYFAIDEPVTVLDVPCVPDHCQSCERDGLCETRRQMRSYTPAEFAEIEPVRRTRYRRMKASA